MHLATLQPPYTLHSTIMPSAKASSNTGSKSSSSNNNKPNNAIKEGPGSQGGTGVSKNFTESYGLKMYEPEEYEEAQAIQQAFRDEDKKNGGK